MTSPTKDELATLRECFEVRGHALFWKIRPLSHFSARNTWAFANKHAGSRADKPKGATGYMIVRFALGGRINRQLYAHSIIWFLHYGEWPEMLDHINRVKHDNRIENLRLTTKLSNNRNRLIARRDSTTGFMGVLRANGNFMAVISVGCERQYLGRFKTPEEAHAVYMEAKRRLHPEAFDAAAELAVQS